MARRMMTPTQRILREFAQLSPSEQTVVLDCLTAWSAASKSTGPAERSTRSKATAPGRALTAQQFGLPSEAKT